MFISCWGVILILRLVFLISFGKLGQ